MSWRGDEGINHRNPIIGHVSTNLKILEVIHDKVFQTLFVSRRHDIRYNDTCDNDENMTLQ